MEEKLKQAEKLALLHDEPELAIFDELQEANVLLKEIAKKEFPEPKDFPAFPEFPKPLDAITVKNLPDIQKVEVLNFPLQKEMDMTKTNTLLQRLLEKETEPIEICVSLKIE